MMWLKIFVIYLLGYWISLGHFETVQWIFFKLNLITKFKNWILCKKNVIYFISQLPLSEVHLKYMCIFDIASHWGKANSAMLISMWSIFLNEWTLKLIISGIFAVFAQVCALHFSISCLVGYYILKIQNTM